MSNPTNLRRAVVLLVASSFLTAGAAHAATDALVKLRWSFEGNAPYPNTQMQGTQTAAPTAGNPWLASVGAGPTPSVMWPANVFTATSQLSFGGTITPNGATNPTTSRGGVYFSFTRIASTHNEQGYLKKNNVPPLTVTVNWPATSTICNNSCQPRYGFGVVSPTPSRRYGGTARLVRAAAEHFIFKNAYGGFSDIYFKGAATAMAYGPQVLGNYYDAGQLYVTNQTTYGTFQSDFQGLSAPYSTGMARAFQDLGNYTTDLTRTGSFNMPPLSQVCPGAPNCGAPGYAYTPVGSISLVRPGVSQSFAKIGGSVIGLGSFANAGVFQLKVTFLPEPGQLAMLGTGTLTLAALYRRRS